MFTFMYEPVRSLGSCIADGGVVHAVNTNRIEDIYFWGDMASVCLVSGERFDVTRHDAILLLDSLGKWGEGASKEISRLEEAGWSYESTKRETRWRPRDEGISHAPGQ